MKVTPLILALTAVNLAAAGVAVVRASGPAQAADAPKTLSAQELNLVDARGRVRGQLKVENDGEVVFRLRDQKGQVRIKMGASERGSGLILMDDKTEPGIHLITGVSRLDNRRETTVTLNDAGQRRVISPRS